MSKSKNGSPITPPTINPATTTTTTTTTTSKIINTMTPMIRVANYLVEFKRNKFRISLPSRRVDDNHGNRDDEAMKCDQSSSSAKHRSYYPNVSNSSSSTIDNNFVDNSLLSCGQNNNSGNSINIKNRSQWHITTSSASLQRHIETHFEYVYFNEDLIANLAKVLSLNTTAVINNDDDCGGRQASSPSCESTPITNYRCMIYNNDMLCFNLLLGQDGQVIGSPIRVNAITPGACRNVINSSIPDNCPPFIANNRPSTSISDNSIRTEIAPQTKVFDQSIIYLFKEMCNISDCTQESKILDKKDYIAGQDGATMAPSPMVIEDRAPVSDNKKNHTSAMFEIAVNDDDDDADADDRRQKSEQILVKQKKLKPNFGKFPNTSCAFPVSSYSSSSSESCDDDSYDQDTNDEEMMEVDDEDASERINDCSLLSTENEYWQIDETNSCAIGEMQDTRNIEQSQILYTTESRKKAKSDDSLANASSSSSRHHSRSTIFSEESFEVIQESIGGEKQPQSKTDISIFADANNSGFEDPYENQESIQAQERLLEEQELVYTQMIEILSDDDEEDVKNKVKKNHRTAEIDENAMIDSNRDENSESSDSPPSVPSSVAIAENKSGEELISGLLDQLFASHDVHEMSKYFRENWLLKRVDIKRRERLVSAIERVLCANGFNCQLFIFGSTKNSLGMDVSSDIDIFIQLKDARGSPIDETHISYGKIQHVLHRIHRILGRDQSYLDAMRDPPAKTAARNDNVNEDEDEDENSCVITLQTICHRHMRVPITRLKIYFDARPLLPQSSSSSASVTPPPPMIFSNSPDNMLQCDFNVNNALGIANTRLIRFLCRFEPRFFVLNVLLRFWCKKVAKLNNPDCLSSYALTNMIVFFCQTRKPQILPAIDYFVKLSPTPKIVNDWRCDFCKDPAKISFHTTNTESVQQLFVGFFRYYRDFNFLQCKISTRYGRAWRLRAGNNSNNFNNRARRQLMANRVSGNNNVASKSDAAEIVNISRREMDRLICVHIMDPFEQSHNLTARMRWQSFEHMCREFDKAAQQYRRYVS